MAILSGIERHKTDSMLESCAENRKCPFSIMCENIDQNTGSICILNQKPSAGVEENCVIQNYGW